jgi:CheY-like chemotaxis protein
MLEGHTNPGGDALPNAKPRVLVIDDDRQVLRIFERLLADDFTVTTEVSAADALERMHHGDSFDVILCDRNLGPGMSGQDFYATVSPEVQSRIVICSGSVFDPNDAFVAALGERIFFKTHTGAELVALLERVARAHLCRPETALP